MLIATVSLVPAPVVITDTRRRGSALSCLPGRVRHETRYSQSD